MKLDANTSKEKLKYKIAKDKCLYKGFFEVSEYHASVHHKA